jgi:hypothetical protein
VLIACYSEWPLLVGGAPIKCPSTDEWMNKCNKWECKVNGHSENTSTISQNVRVSI